MGRRCARINFKQTGPGSSAPAKGSFAVKWVREEILGMSICESCFRAPRIFECEEERRPSLGSRKDSMDKICLWMEMIMLEECKWQSLGVVALFGNQRDRMRTKSQMMGKLKWRRKKRRGENN